MSANAPHAARVSAPGRLTGRIASERIRFSELEPLVRAARLARARAYAPYSHFRVGAAILTPSGQIYAGANVENATYGATLCAERSAVSAMIAAGDGAPMACVIVSGGAVPAAPCGICRQVLAEFARDLAVWLVADDDEGHLVAKRRTSLALLLPHPFRLSDHAAAGPPRTRRSRATMRKRAHGQ